MKCIDETCTGSLRATQGWSVKDGGRVRKRVCDTCSQPVWTDEKVRPVTLVDAIRQRQATADANRARRTITIPIKNSGGTYDR